MKQSEEWQHTTSAAFSAILIEFFPGVHYHQKSGAYFTSFPRNAPQQFVHRVFDTRYFLLAGGIETGL
jgi:hypothetical protein